MWTSSGTRLDFASDMPATELEPVKADAKKLRRTAWILVAIMIAGGVLILSAYEKRANEGAADDRPSFVGRISELKDLSFMRQDGRIIDLMDMKGKVVLVQCLAQGGPDPVTTEVMKHFSEEYTGNPELMLLTLMLDPGSAENLEAELRQMAENLGAALPQWTVGSTERETLHRFIKNEFKANMLPHEESGKWIYDRSLVLIDRNRHVRRAVIPQKRGGAAYVAAFDFEQAGKWDEEGIKTGTNLSNLRQMEILLGETIRKLLGEEVKS